MGSGDDGSHTSAHWREQDLTTVKPMTHAEWLLELASWSDTDLDDDDKDHLRKIAIALEVNAICQHHYGRPNQYHAILRGGLYYVTDGVTMEDRSYVSVSFAQQRVNALNNEVYRSFRREQDVQRVPNGSSSPSTVDSGRSNMADTLATPIGKLGEEIEAEREKLLRLEREEHQARTAAITVRQALRKLEEEFDQKVVEFRREPGGLRDTFWCNNHPQAEET